MTPEQTQAQLMAWRAIAQHHAPTATIEDAVPHLYTDAQGELRYIPPAAPAPDAHLQAGLAAIAANDPPAAIDPPAPAAGQPAPALVDPAAADSPPAAGVTLHQLLLSGSTPPAAAAAATPAEITPQAIAAMSQEDWLKQRNGVYASLYGGNT